MEKANILWLVLLLWLPGCYLGNLCNVGEIVWNEVMQRNEGRTVKLDCSIMWPSANQRFCKKFKFKVANYEKLYFACGHCNADGEFGPYTVSKTLKETDCHNCNGDFCFEYEDNGTVSLRSASSAGFRFILVALVFDSIF
ncbi:hypothetical protein ACHWQZ_G004463 [Mnemiopsis leidyi]